jgi:hypothetical protein
VRTPEDRAAADAELVDVEPELDRRLIRCRCRHSLDAHPPPRTPAEVGLLAIPEDAFTSPPCTRCPCDRFHARPAPWRVCRDSVYALSVALAGPWCVVSPRGVEMYRAWTQPEAAELGRAMASIDELLARVHRLESNMFGGHPALAASARRAPAGLAPPRPVDLTEERPTLTLVEGQEGGE